MYGPPSLRRDGGPDKTVLGLKLPQLPSSNASVIALPVIMSSGLRIISGKEVSQHNTRESCWIIVHGDQVSVACSQISAF